MAARWGYHVNPFWLIRLARWARRPPPLARVILFVIVALLCLALVGIERVWGWPDWLTVNGRLRAPKF